MDSDSYYSAKTTVRFYFGDNIRKEMRWAMHVTRMWESRDKNRNSVWRP